MLTIQERNTQVDIVCPNCGKSRKVKVDTMRRWNNVYPDKSIEDYKNVPCKECKILLAGDKVRGLTENKYEVKCAKCGKVRIVKRMAVYSWLMVHQNSTVEDYFKNALCRSCVGLNESGETINAQGYAVIVLKESDPYFCMGINKHNNHTSYCLKHRYVMAWFLGRPLESWECVHHKDGNKLNNSPYNLQIVTRQSHLTVGFPIEKEKHYIDLILKLRKEIEDLKSALDNK